MPYVTLEQSPGAMVETKSTLYYRDTGSGTPLLILHGGWGYEAYPFDRQIEEFGERFRIVIPDRSGYGQSSRAFTFTVDFHWRAAQEMMAFLDTLGWERCALWGHSDGAVIAAWMAIAKPERFSGIILEAFHFYRNKPQSRAFFETGATNPDAFGSRIADILAREHGEDDWQALIRNASAAWLQLADESPRPDSDLFDGRLVELSVPALFIHGGQDPRTEPDELARVRHALPHAEIRVIENGGHSPHSESASAAECNRHAARFLGNLET